MGIETNTDKFILKILSSWTLIHFFLDIFSILLFFVFVFSISQASETQIYSFRLTVVGNPLQEKFLGLFVLVLESVFLTCDAKWQKHRRGQLQRILYDKTKRPPNIRLLPGNVKSKWSGGRPEIQGTLLEIRFSLNTKWCNWVWFLADLQILGTLLLQLNGKSTDAGRVFARQWLSRTVSITHQSERGRFCLSCKHMRIAN